MHHRSVQNHRGTMHESETDSVGDGVAVSSCHDGNRLQPEIATCLVEHQSDELSDFCWAMFSIDSPIKQLDVALFSIRFSTEKTS